MAKYNQKFKTQAVEKVLSRKPGETIEQIAKVLNVGYSTLQKWMRLARDNKLEGSNNTMPKEQRPQNWNNTQRLDAIMHCHNLDEGKVSAYCREKGIYQHYLEQWKADFLTNGTSTDKATKQEQRKLKQENRRLQKELNRKDKALSETAALLVLSKKCQAIWGENVVD
jgi:transposase-like protein